MARHIPTPTPSPAQPGGGHVSTMRGGGSAHGLTRQQGPVLLQDTHMMIVHLHRRHLVTARVLLQSSTILNVPHICHPRRFVVGMEAVR